MKNDKLYPQKKNIVKNFFFSRIRLKNLLIREKFAKKIKVRQNKTKQYKINIETNNTTTKIKTTIKAR